MPIEVFKKCDRPAEGMETITPNSQYKIDYIRHYFNTIMKMEKDNYPELVKGGAYATVLKCILEFNTTLRNMRRKKKNGPLYSDSVYGYQYYSDDVKARGGYYDKWTLLIEPYKFDYLLPYAPEIGMKTIIDKMAPMLFQRYLRGNEFEPIKIYNTTYSSAVFVGYSRDAARINKFNGDFIKNTLSNYFSHDVPKWFVYEFYYNASGTDLLAYDATSNFYGDNDAYLLYYDSFTDLTTKDEKIVFIHSHRGPFDWYFGDFGDLEKHYTTYETEITDDILGDPITRTKPDFKNILNASAKLDDILSRFNTAYENYNKLKHETENQMLGQTLSDEIRMTKNAFYSSTTGLIENENYASTIAICNSLFKRTTEKIDDFSKLSNIGQKIAMATADVNMADVSFNNDGFKPDVFIKQSDIPKTDTMIVPYSDLDKEIKDAHAISFSTPFDLLQALDVSATHSVEINNLKGIVKKFIDENKDTDTLTSISDKIRLGRYGTITVEDDSGVKKMFIQYLNKTGRADFNAKMKKKLVVDTLKYSYYWLPNLDAINVKNPDMYSYSSNVTTLRSLNDKSGIIREQNSNKIFVQIYDGKNKEEFEEAEIPHAANTLHNLLKIGYPQIVMMYRGGDSKTYSPELKEYCSKVDDADGKFVKINTYVDEIRKNTEMINKGFFDAKDVLNLRAIEQRNSFIIEGIKHILLTRNLFAINSELIDGSNNSMEHILNRMIESYEKFKKTFDFSIGNKIIYSQFINDAKSNSGLLRAMFSTLRSDTTGTYGFRVKNFYKTGSENILTNIYKSDEKILEEFLDMYESTGKSADDAINMIHGYEADEIIMDADSFKEVGKKLEKTYSDLKILNRTIAAAKSASTSTDVDINKISDTVGQMIARNLDIVNITSEKLQQYVIESNIRTDLCTDLFDMVNDARMRQDNIEKLSMLYESKFRELESSKMEDHLKMITSEGYYVHTVTVDGADNKLYDGNHKKFSELFHVDKSVRTKSGGMIKMMESNIILAKHNSSNVQNYTASIRELSKTETLYYSLHKSIYDLIDAFALLVNSDDCWVSALMMSREPEYLSVFDKYVEHNLGKDNGTVGLFGKNEFTNGPITQLKSINVLEKAANNIGEAYEKIVKLLRVNKRIENLNSSLTKELDIHPYLEELKDMVSFGTTFLKNDYTTYVDGNDIRNAIAGICKSSDTEPIHNTIRKNVLSRLIETVADSRNTDLKELKKIRDVMNDDAEISNVFNTSVRNDQTTAIKNIFNAIKDPDADNDNRTKAYVRYISKKIGENDPNDVVTKILNPALKKYTISKIKIFYNKLGTYLNTVARMMIINDDNNAEYTQLNNILQKFEELGRKLNNFVNEASMDKFQEEIVKNSVYEAYGSKDVDAKTNADLNSRINKTYGMYINEINKFFYDSGTDDMSIAANPVKIGTYGGGTNDIELTTKDADILSIPIGPFCFNYVQYLKVFMGGATIGTKADDTRDELNKMAKHYSATYVVDEHDILNNGGRHKDYYSKIMQGCMTGSDNFFKNKKYYIEFGKINETKFNYALESIKNMIDAVMPSVTQCHNLIEGLTEKFEIKETKVCYMFNYNSNSIFVKHINTNSIYQPKDAVQMIPPILFLKNLTFDLTDVTEYNKTSRNIVSRSYMLSFNTPAGRCIFDNFYDNATDKYVFFRNVNSTNVGTMIKDINDLRNTRDEILKNTDFNRNKVYVDDNMFGADVGDDIKCTFEGKDRAGTDPFNTIIGDSGDTHIFPQIDYAKYIQVHSINIPGTTDLNDKNSDQTKSLMTVFKSIMFVKDNYSKFVRIMNEIENINADKYDNGDNLGDVKSERDELKSIVLRLVSDVIIILKSINENSGNYVEPIKQLINRDILVYADAIKLKVTNTPINTKTFVTIMGFACGFCFKFCNVALSISAHVLFVLSDPDKMKIIVENLKEKGDEISKEIPNDTGIGIGTLFDGGADINWTTSAGIQTAIKNYSENIVKYYNSAKKEIEKKITKLEEDVKKYEITEKITNPDDLATPFESKKIHIHYSSSREYENLKEDLDMHYVGFYNKIGDQLNQATDKTIPLMEEFNSFLNATAEIIKKFSFRNVMEINYMGFHDLWRYNFGPFEIMNGGSPMYGIYVKSGVTGKDAFKSVLDEFIENNIDYSDYSLYANKINELFRNINDKYDDKYKSGFELFHDVKHGAFELEKLKDEFFKYNGNIKNNLKEIVDEIWGEAFGGVNFNVIYTKITDVMREIEYRDRLINVWRNPPDRNSTFRSLIIDILHNGKIDTPISRDYDKIISEILIKNMDSEFNLHNMIQFIKQAFDYKFDIAGTPPVAARDSYEQQCRQRTAINASVSMTLLKTIVLVPHMFKVHFAIKFAEFVYGKAKEILETDIDVTRNKQYVGYRMMAMKMLKSLIDDKLYKGLILSKDPSGEYKMDKIYSYKNSIGTEFKNYGNSADDNFSDTATHGKPDPTNYYYVFSTTKSTTPKIDKILSNLKMIKTYDPHDLTESLKKEYDHVKKLMSKETEIVREIYENEIPMKRNLELLKLVNKIAGQIIFKDTTIRTTPFIKPRDISKIKQKTLENYNMMNSAVDSQLAKLDKLSLRYDVKNSQLINYSVFISTLGKKLGVDDHDFDRVKVYKYFTFGLADFYADIIDNILECLNKPFEAMHQIEKFYYIYTYISLLRCKKMFKFFREYKNKHQLEEQNKIKSGGKIDPKDRFLSKIMVVKNFEGNIASIFKEFNFIRPLLDEYQSTIMSKVSLHIRINDYNYVTEEKKISLPEEHMSYGPTDKEYYEYSENRVFIESKSKENTLLIRNENIIPIDIVTDRPENNNLAIQRLHINYTKTHEQLSKKYPETHKLKNKNGDIELDFERLYSMEKYPDANIISNYMSLATNISRKKGAIIITYGYSGVGKTTTLFGKGNEVVGLLQTTLDNFSDDTIYFRSYEIYGLGAPYDFYWNQRDSAGNLKANPNIYSLLIHHENRTTPTGIENNQLVPITNRFDGFSYIMACEDPEFSKPLVMGKSYFQNEIKEKLLGDELAEMVDPFNRADERMYQWKKSPFIVIKKEQYNNFQKFVEEIETKRSKVGFKSKNTGEFIKTINKTVNNPVSSRSIMVYEFQIKQTDEDGNRTFVPFIIYDMPGREDIYRTYVAARKLRDDAVINFNPDDIHDIPINDTDVRIFFNPMEKLSTILMNPVFIPTYYDSSFGSLVDRCIGINPLVAKKMIDRIKELEYTLVQTSFYSQGSALKIPNDGHFDNVSLCKFYLEKLLLNNGTEFVSFNDLKKDEQFIVNKFITRIGTNKLKTHREVAGFKDIANNYLIPTSDLTIMPDPYKFGHYGAFAAGAENMENHVRLTFEISGDTLKKDTTSMFFCALIAVLIENSYFEILSDLIQEITSCEIKYKFLPFEAYYINENINGILKILLDILPSSSEKLEHAEQESINDVVKDATRYVNSNKILNIYSNMKTPFKCKTDTPLSFVKKKYVDKLEKDILLKEEYEKFTPPHYIIKENGDIINFYNVGAAIVKVMNINRMSTLLMNKGMYDPSVIFRSGTLDCNGNENYIDFDVFNGTNVAAAYYDASKWNSSNDMIKTRLKYMVNVAKVNYDAGNNLIDAATKKTILGNIARPSLLNDTEPLFEESPTLDKTKVLNPNTKQLEPIKNDPIIEDYIKPYKKKLDFYYVLFLVTNNEKLTKSEAQLSLIENSMKFVSALTKTNAGKKKLTCAQ